MSRSSSGAARGLGSKVLLRGALLVLWACFIWGHSLVPGTLSSQESGFVYRVLGPFFESLGILDGELCTFIIRKAAHVSEYALLGVLSVLFVRALADAGRLSGRRRALAAALCMLVPVVDETIQLFVPGRSGSVRDVCIDLCGMALGAGITTAVAKLRQKA